MQSVYMESIHLHVSVKPYVININKLCFTHVTLICIENSLVRAQLVPNAYVRLHSETELEFRNVDFYGGRTRRKTLVARERTNKQLNSHAVPEPRVEPTTHWNHSGEKRASYRNATSTLCTK
jgi:hypothetical protein